MRNVRLHTLIVSFIGLFYSFEAYSTIFNTPIVNDNNRRLVEWPIIDMVPDPRSFGMKYILLSNGISEQNLYSLRPVSDSFERDAADTYFAFNTVFDKKPTLSVLDNRTAYVSSEQSEKGRIAIEYVKLNLAIKGYKGRVLTQLQSCDSYNVTHYKNHGVVMKDEVPTALGTATLQIGSFKELSMVAIPLDGKYGCQFYPLGKFDIPSTIIVETSLVDINLGYANLLVNGKHKAIKLTDKLFSLPQNDASLYLK